MHTEPFPWGSVSRGPDPAVPAPAPSLEGLASLPFPPCHGRAGRRSRRAADRDARESVLPSRRHHSRATSLSSKLGSLPHICRVTSEMDTIDRPDSNVPARYPGDSSRVPAPIAAMPRDLASRPSRSAPQITPRILLRGLSRHWWRIMLFWLVISTPLAYLIYALVEPTFEAVSLLRVEPTQMDIYNPSSRQHRQTVGGQALPPDPGPADHQRQRAGRGPRQAGDQQPADDPVVEGPEGRPARADERRDRRRNTYLIRGRAGLARTRTRRPRSSTRWWKPTSISTTATTDRQPALKANLETERDQAGQEDPRNAGQS